MIHGTAQTDNSLSRAVAIWNEPGRTVPFIKGRVAFYAILRALGVGPGDEVLVPGFTCVVVPAAVIYTGATPTTNFFSSGHAPVDDGEWHHAALVREAALGNTQGINRAGFLALQACKVRLYARLLSDQTALLDSQIAKLDLNGINAQNQRTLEVIQIWQL